MCEPGGGRREKWPSLLIRHPASRFALLSRQQRRRLSRHQRPTGHAHGHLCEQPLWRLAKVWRRGSRVRWRGPALRQPATPDRRQRYRAPLTQHCGHRTDRSFRNYGRDNVAHDRRPQTVTL